MSLLGAEIVESEKLAEVVVVAFVAGVGVSAIFGVAIHGATRMVDASRDGRGTVATAYAVLAALSLGAVIAAVVFGIVVMTTK